MKINESIEKHNELNQKLFDGDKLKPEVRQKMEDIVNEYLKLLAEDEIKLIVRDVILTGSNASFNYTDKSDADVHIIADTTSFNNIDGIYDKLYNAYRRIFDYRYEIDFYGVPVEFYVETENNPVVSNGIYSIMFDKWVKVPNANAIPEIDQNAVDKEVAPWKEKAEKLIKEIDDNSPSGEEKIDKFISELYELRQKGIYENGGEYAMENLIFKELRNLGLLDKLKDLKHKIIASKLSLKEGITYLDDAKEFMDYGTGEVDGTNVIDTNKASTFGTQDLLNGSTDAIYDGLTYDIVELSPDQYFELCSKVQHESPETLKQYILDDDSRLQHLKDVIVKYKKKFPLPYVSFSDNTEIGTQEGKHRMFVLGEIFGWDVEFPVMVIQEKNNKKSIEKLLNESITEAFELDERTRREYVIKIARIAHDQPIVQPNGLFELYNVKEADVSYILAALNREDWVEYVQKSAERYDFSRMSYAGLPLRYFKITGKIRI